MKLDLYQIDAFTDKVFSGNPAGVVPLGDWLDDDILQKIAAENNLSETAFFVKKDDHYSLRWFTPKVEVDLCGHATLASGYVIMNHLEPGLEKVIFHTKSGELVVQKEGAGYLINFPVWNPKACETPEGLGVALGGVDIQDTFYAEDLFVVLRNENDVKELVPDLELIKSFPFRGIVVTAPGDSSDFVSRAFFPGIGVPEDPVTGSTHCALTPYWSRQLGKETLTAKQISSRGGELLCSLVGDTVNISGDVALYLKGVISL